MFTAACGTDEVVAVVRLSLERGYVNCKESTEKGCPKSSWGKHTSDLVVARVG